MGLFLTRRGIKAHGAHGCLQYRADGLFPIPAKNTDIEEQDEAARRFMDMFTSSSLVGRAVVAPMRKMPKAATAPRMMPMRWV